MALARRDVLLRIHRFRLRREDLEDCFSQATLELVVLARKGRAFSSRRHIANALEQRFVARTQDRRRAVSGRSPIQAALEESVSFGAEGGQVLELADPRSDPARVVMLRQELELLRVCAESLTDDQRLVIASSVGLGMSCAEFCAIHGWSAEKYRKVAQRARARLRAEMYGDEAVTGSAGGRNNEQGPACER